MDTLQTVALIDTTGPEFTVMDTTIVCDDWDSFVPPAIEVTDNCSPGDSVTFAFTDTVTDGFFPFQFTLDRIYTATDLCGNSTVDTMTISVIDTVAPTGLPAAGHHHPLRPVGGLHHHPAHCRGQLRPRTRRTGRRWCNRHHERRGRVLRRVPRRAHVRILRHERQHDDFVQVIDAVDTIPLDLPLLPAGHGERLQ